MKSRSIVTALVVMLLAPLPLLAQQGGGQGRGGMGGGLMGARVLMEQGSVEFLTTKAADLQLNEEQVAGLKVIGEKWAADTKEDRAKVLAELPQGGQGMGGGDRQAMMQRIQGLQPVMQKIREADEQAVGEALKLLNETQQAAAKKLIEERRQPRRPPGR